MGAGRWWTTPGATGAALTLLVALGLRVSLVRHPSHWTAPRPSASVVESAPSASVPQVRSSPWTTLGPGARLYRTEWVDSTGAKVAWRVVRVDLSRVALSVRHPSENRLAALGQDPSILFAVNGGFFEPDLAPSGLLVADGVVKRKWTRGGGSGVLVVKNGMAQIGTAAPADLAGVSLAVQCGPRLIEPGGALGMRSDDGKRASRTVVCVRRGGRELDVVAAYDAAGSAWGGPTLLQTAQWLKAPLSPDDDGDSEKACDAALNLDGGPSTGLVAPSIPETDWKLPLGPVPWAIAGVASPH